jgi:hypothetical protein
MLVQRLTRAGAAVAAVTVGLALLSVLQGLIPPIY